MQYRFSITPKNLLDLRLNAGMNQTEFGILFGYSRAMISNYENGIYEIPRVLALACWQIRRHGVPQHDMWHDYNMRRDAAYAAAMHEPGEVA